MRTSAPGNASTQRGIALLILTIVLAMAAISYLVANLSAEETRIDSQIQSQEVLKKAKQALIEHAFVNYDRGGNDTGRFGNLPCPDSNAAGAEGDQDPNCGNLDTNAIGYFPWKRMGVEVLKDASGTCLLYAVSPGYKLNNKRMLNEDSDGLFQIVDNSGNVIIGNTPDTRPVAVIFSPNYPVAGQLRNIDSTTICGWDYNNINAYLDNNGVVDNGALSGIANTIDQFVHASPGSANTANPLNDTFVTIQKNEVWDSILSRGDFNIKMRNLTNALAKCLRNYSTTDMSNRRLPWPAPMNLAGGDYTRDDDYDDAGGGAVFAGRYPFKVDSSNSALGRSGGDDLFTMPGVCVSIPLLVGPGAAVFSDEDNEYRELWENWKDHIFYAVSRVYDPAFGGAGQSECNPVTNDCITVDGTPYAGVVIFSGSKLAGQSRNAPPPSGDPDDKAVIANYIENNNAAVFSIADGTQTDAYNPVDPATSNDIMWCITNKPAGGFNILDVVEC